MGDVDDPVEQGHIMGQAGEQAQAEGGLEGFALQGPEQGHQGEDQQLGLVPLGKGRGQ